LRIERTGNHGLRIQPAPFQPAHGTPGFLGASSVKGGSNVERGLRMRAAMPAHQQIESVRTPPPACRVKALAIECRRQIGVRGNACRAQFIEQEPQLVGYPRMVRRDPHTYWICTGAAPQPARAPHVGIAERTFQVL
jgi:hypothetical protein